MLENWKKKKLKELATINYGKSPKEIIAEDGHVPVVGTGGVERFGKDYLYDGESVILGRKGTIDKPNYINGKFWAIDTAYFLSDFNQANVKWLYYFLTTIDLRSMNEATGVPSLSRDFLYKLEIPTPPRDEQQQIATILACIDRVIELTEVLIAKQQRLKAGLMQQLLTKGIDEDGNIRSEATHEFKDSPLGRIPKGWNVQCIEELTTKIVDGVHKTPRYVESGVPFITISDMTNGSGISFQAVRYVTQRDHEEFKKRADPQAGDVLVTKDGTLGIARIIPEGLPEFSIFVSVAMLRPNKKLCLPQLIGSFFESGRFERQLGKLSAGTGLKHIHLEHFRQFLIAVPPVHEQEAIFPMLEKQASQIQKQEAYLDKLRQIKRGLMQDLLTGKIRVKALLEAQSRTDGQNKRQSLT